MALLGALEYDLLQRDHHDEGSLDLLLNDLSRPLRDQLALHNCKKFVLGMDILSSWTKGQTSLSSLCGICTNCSLRWTASRKRAIRSSIDDKLARRTASAMRRRGGTCNG